MCRTALGSQEAKVVHEDVGLGAPPADRSPAGVESLVAEAKAAPGAEEPGLPPTPPQAVGTVDPELVPEIAPGERENGVPEELRPADRVLGTPAECGLDPLVRIERQKPVGSMRPRRGDEITTVCRLVPTRPVGRAPEDLAH